MRRNRQLQGGGALLLTIGVMASLVAILVAAAATERVTLRGIGNRTAARRARLMADAGIQQALATLSSQSTTQTTQQDPWYQLGQTADTRYVVGDDSFRIQIVDAAGLINLNTATVNQLSRLPLTQEQVDSLLDWREGTPTPRTDGGKDEYYNGLTTPYNAKLRAMNTLDELLLIKAFTPKTLYEPQTDTFSTQPLPNKPDGTAYTLYDLCTVDSTSTLSGPGGGRLPNISTVTSANQLIQRGIPPQVANTIFNQRQGLRTYNALLGVPGVTPAVARTLVNNYSVSNATTLTGKIDLNTASDAVLETLPGITPDIATAMVAQQGTGFTQLGDVFNVSGFTTAIARQAFDSVAINSQTFLVHVMGVAGTARVSLDAFITISASGPRILKICQPPYADMAKRWGWDDQTTTDNILLEATH
jgi:type II secretory pathway component PulK